MLLPITLTIAAAAALLNIWLAIRCGVTRAAQKVMMGDGGNPVMVARMRAHANFVENAPLFLILLGLNELADGSARWLVWIGIVFIVARILHPIGMDRPAPNAFRATGAGLTMLVMIVLAGSAIRLAYTVGQPTILG